MTYDLGVSICQPRKNSKKERLDVKWVAVRLKLLVQMRQARSQHTVLNKRLPESKVLRSEVQRGQPEETLFQIKHAKAPTSFPGRSRSVNFTWIE